MNDDRLRGAWPLGMVDTGINKTLWRDCPWEGIGSSVRGTKFFDEFENVAPVPTNTTVLTGKYAAFTGATGTQTFTQVGDVQFGEAALTASATDNMDVAIQTGGNTGGIGVFRDPAVSNPHDIWFEARLKVSQITSGNAFVGLMDPGAVATGGVITASDALADKNYIGFAVLHGAPATLVFTYKRVSVTAVVPIATLHTLVADTYVNVGFTYLQSNPVAGRITVYKTSFVGTTGTATKQNGVAKAAIVTGTFPTVDALSLTAGVMTNGAAAKVLTMDWWKVAMAEN